MNQKQLSRRFPEMKEEIEQAVFIGKYIAVSPAYTFCRLGYSKYGFMKNVKLERVYAVLVNGRGKAKYDCDLILMGKHKEQIRIHLNSSINMYQLRLAYDRFSPRVLIGEKGAEKSTEELFFINQKKKRMSMAACCLLLMLTLLIAFSKNVLIWAIGCVILIATCIYFIRDYLKSVK